MNDPAAGGAAIKPARWMSSERTRLTSNDSRFSVSVLTTSWSRVTWVGERSR